ncbi:extracellular solute-binding protein [Ruminiclostridium herbifermentans]|uniref:Extracellular solute-binding protein n=1 Tax=Ruminiclostridium herbifermentans TaxID=2488810 RepID=A0A4V6EQQ9_9FIRM|nr:extracellular solute-binding protein [Ruminiclostridium herbifermentans]QNU67329.1 extracellular solute-binding protein [Ruminiclostridium herbifermentans]
MKTLKTILILIILIGLLSSTACSFNGDSERSDGKHKLKINVMENDNFLRNAIKKFNSDSKDCTIEEKVYYQDQYKKYSEDTQAGLVSNDGADIIVTSPDRIPMLSKYIDNGYLSELDDLYNNDKSINRDDYYSEIMNYGIYKGKRYLIPLSYTIDAFFTTESIIEKEGINGLSDEVNWDKFSQVCSDYVNKNEGSSHYMLSNIDFSSIIRGIGADIIDIENKIAKFDTTPAKSAIKQYKLINESVTPDKVFYEKIQGGDISAILKNKDAVFLNNAISSPQNLWYNYSSFNTEVQPMVYSVCTAENKIPARVSLFAAVSSKCTNKKEAYEFISMLLSKDYQAEDFLNGIPVSKSAYEQIKYECIKGNNGERSGRGGGCKSDDSIKVLLSKVDRYLARLTECKIEDYEVYTLIDSKIRECVSKNETDDGIAKSLQEVVENYFKKTLIEDSQNQSEAITGDNSIRANLSIVYINYNGQVKNAIRKSKELYPEIEYSENVFGDDQYSEMNTKLSAELMSGDGPDIIIFGPNTFNSLYKVANSGIFTDLNELISKDKDFSKNDYYENIFDCGIYNNKRLYIPLEYAIPYFRTTDLTLKENNIVIDKSDLSLDSLYKLSQDFLKNNKDKNKSLIYCNFGFSSMMRISGKKFVDNEKRKSYFNTKDFINLLKIYKEIYPAIAPYDTCAKYNSYVDMIKDKRLVMAFEQGNQSPKQLWTFNSMYNQAIGDDMDIIPLVDNGICYARVGECIGINSNCENKEAAFNFLKIMLSKDIQKATDSYGNHNGALLLPINKQAYNEDLNYYMSNSTSGFGSEYSSKELPKKLADKLNILLGKTQIEQRLDNEVQNIVHEALDNYISGKATAEQTAKAIDDKVTLFLNE